MLDTTVRGDAEGDEDIVVIGLDLSLARTGAVAWDGEDIFGHLCVRSTTALCLEARIDLIRRQVLKFITDLSPDLIVVESGARGGKHVDLNVYHLAGVVRWALWRRQWPFALMTPGQIKKDATGDGRATKPMMLAAARDIWPGCPNHDVADALHAARLGWRRYGELVETID